MKYIKGVEDFRQADGQPHEISNPDRSIQRAAREEAIAAGKESWAAPMIEATFPQAMVHFVDQMPLTEGEYKASDMASGLAVIRCFQEESQDCYVLEEAPYKWLVEMMNGEKGIKCFRFTQALILEHLADLLPEPGTPAED